MTTKSFWLIFLSFLALATSQSVPITNLDQMLRDTDATMKAKEAKLSNLLSSSAVDLDVLSAGPAPALSTAANSYKSTLMDLSTISNFDSSRNSSSCADINMKISSIKFDLQKILGLSRQASQNLSTLTTKMNYVTYYYTINYRILTPAQVSNYIAIVNGFYSIANEYNFYVYYLGVAYNNETYVMSNLNAYKNVYCSCGTKTKEDSTLESNLAYIQRPLEKDQTRTRSALLAASSAVNRAISKIPINPKTSLVVGNLQFLSDFLAKSSTISDYTKINAGRKTSCDEWQKRRILVLCLFYEYEKISTQIYSNLTTLNAYLAAVNVTVGTVNLTLNAGQGNALQSACNSMGFCSSLFTGYLNDVKNAMTMISSVLAEISSIGDSFCACTEKMATTTTDETTLSDFKEKSKEILMSTTIPTTTSTTISKTSTTIPTTTTTTVPTTTTKSTTSTAVPTTTTTTKSTTTSTTIPTTTTTTVPTTTTTKSTTTTTVPTTSTTVPTTTTTQSTTTIPTTSTTVPTTTTTQSTTTIPTTSTTVSTTTTKSTTTVPTTSTTIPTTTTTVPTTTTTKSTTKIPTTSTTVPTTTTTKSTTTIPTTTTTVPTTTTTIPTTSTTVPTTTTTKSTTTTTTPTTTTTIPTTTTTVPPTTTSTTKAIISTTTIPKTSVTTTRRGGGRRTTTLPTTVTTAKTSTTVPPLPPPPETTTKISSTIPTTTSTTKTTIPTTTFSTSTTVPTTTTKAPTTTIPATTTTVQGTRTTLPGASTGSKRRRTSTKSTTTTKAAITTTTTNGFILPRM